MSWTELSIVSQRQEFVVLASASGANIRELSRRFGISSKTGYNWLKRVFEHNPRKDGESLPRLRRGGRNWPRRSGLDRTSYSLTVTAISLRFLG